ncbi:MAG: hypothetical protein KIT56_08155 [Gammaproteobacteria bacterium]|nr:hypothetical protein [Gammaproteobacteria bacterium]MCW5583833.1 hypothetical protein [Gammaproteobacteria bacterium]
MSHVRQKPSHKNNSVSTLSDAERLLTEGAKITPEIMTQYLNLLTLGLLPLDKELSTQIYVPELYHYLYRYIFNNDAGLNRITLMMFKAFLKNQLEKVTNKKITSNAIINVINAVEKKDYLPKKTEEYQELMGDIKKMIFYRGSGNLVKKIDSEFKYYSTNPELLKKFDEEDGIIMDQTKVYYIFEHGEGRNPTHIKKIEDEYKKYLNSMLSDLRKIGRRLKTEENNSSFANESLAISMRKLLDDVEEIAAGEDNSPVRKVIQIAALMTGFYNQIRNEINKFFFFKPHFGISDQILQVLQVLAENTKNTKEKEIVIGKGGIMLSYTQPAGQVTLKISKWVNVQDRILDRANLDAGNKLSTDGVSFMEAKRYQ